MKEITISVTEEDIAEAQKGYDYAKGEYLCTTCPIARATSRAIGVAISARMAGIYAGVIPSKWLCDMPLAARLFMENFDQKKSVSPFDFTIQIL